MGRHYSTRRSIRAPHRADFTIGFFGVFALLGILIALKELLP